MSEADMPAAAQPQEPTEPLPDFCRHKSLTDRRVSLIAGFFAAEQADGHHHATRSEWEARFAAFERRPLT